MKALKSVDVYSNFGFCVPNPFITDNFCLVQPHSKDDVESVRFTATHAWIKVKSFSSNSFEFAAIPN